MSIVDPQSFNGYSYVGGEPTNFVDPSGLNMIVCATYEYGHDYTFPDGTTYHIVEGTYTICYDVGGGGGGTPVGSEPSGGGGQMAAQSPYSKVAYSRPVDKPETTGDCDRTYYKAVSRITRNNYIGQGISYALVLGGLMSGNLWATLGGIGGSGRSSWVAIAQTMDADEDRRECYRRVERRLNNQNA